MTQSLFLRAAIEAAAVAERIIDDYYRRGAKVSIKPDRTPVTEADVAAEQAIIESLSAAFPDHGFYGEESGHAETASGFLWVIDPIDGTKSFVRRSPFFSTQIALLDHDTFELGVSNAPSFGERAWAQRGAGSWLNGEAIRVSDIDRLEDCTLSVGNIKTLAAGLGWKEFGDLVLRVDRFRGYGDFYHYHQLASGRLDLVVESDLHIYDIAALSVIVEEAGGRVTDLCGARLTLDSTTVVASNGRLHEQALEALRLSCEGV